jgi:hypothetical protein
MMPSTEIIPVDGGMELRDGNSAPTRVSVSKAYGTSATQSNRTSLIVLAVLLPCIGTSWMWPADSSPMVLHTSRWRALSCGGTTFSSKSFAAGLRLDVPAMQQGRFSGSSRLVGIEAFALGHTENEV